ncbi:hypothetical protein L9F63_012137 [Diploptera punctata]|uniref:Ionotropic glutamate receptor C-terminal domain-containing protein n=1 Tax=Diploptera punctata TaxID=6984 RepID=A0AAD8AE26_DIPPU|nr:hypothetical protein L9F63_012137 [Diploptera punctata]
MLEEVHIPINSRFVVAKRRGDSVYLTEMYRVTADHYLTKLQLGVWRNGTLAVNKNTIYQGRSDLQGLTMTAITINSMPYSRMTEINDTFITKGSMFSLWAIMERRLNFTTEYLHSDDEFAGIEMDNGSWSGCIAFIKRPGVLEINWGNFWSPFDLSLWMTISITIFSVSVIVEACHRLIKQFGDGCYENHQQPFFIDSLFYTFGAFCSQGQDMTYRSVSVRTAFLVAHFTAVVLMAAYSAGLISSLTIATLNLPFTTYKEMLHDGTYKAGVAAKSSGIGLFKVSKDHVMREVYTKLMEPDPKNFPTTTLEGLRRVCSMKYVFVAQTTRVQAVADQIPCRIVDLPATSVHVNLAIPFSKGNPYRGIINYHLQVMKAGGILQKLKPDELSDLNLGVKSELESLNLGDTAPLLSVLCASMIVGFSLLLLEHKARRLLTIRLYKPEHTDFQLA